MRTVNRSYCTALDLRGVTVGGGGIGGSYRCVCDRPHSMNGAGKRFPFNQTIHGNSSPR